MQTVWKSFKGSYFLLCSQKFVCTWQAVRLVKNGSFQSPGMLIRDLELLCFKPHVVGAGGFGSSRAYVEAELSSVIKKITVSCFVVLCPVIFCFVLFQLSGK